MKTILSALTLMILTINPTQAQINDNFELEDQSLYGLMFDEQGAVGFGWIMNNFMFDIMYKSGTYELSEVDYFGISGKLGWAFELFSNESVNFNLYGMAGYSYFEERYEISEEASGLILEPGALLGLKFGEDFISGIGLGMGYVIDNAIDEEYLDFRFYLIFD